jgi:hypothetical protein
VEAANTPLIPMDSPLDDKVNQIGSYIYPMIAIIGSITNILNICILRRRPIRISPCSYYFLAFACSSLLYIIIRCITQILRIYFSLSSFVSVDSFCKIEAFSVYLLPVHATFMLVFASSDRFCASSHKKCYRDFSKIYHAKRIICLSTILIIIYFCPFLFIIYWDQTIDDCDQDRTVFNIVYLSSRVIILYIILPIAMILFGILTIRNIHHQRNRVISIVMNPGALKFRRNESQLACMLLVQVGVYIIFSVPAAVTYSLMTFSPSMNTPFMTGLRSIAILLQLCIFILSFVIYILSSTIYRDEFVRMLKLNRFFR